MTNEQDEASTPDQPFDNQFPKSTWGPGPWQDEPDHIEWVDPATDLDCMINRGPSGALCGYVGVPPSHPAHGLNYDAVDAEVDVHGGLTYANSCEGNPDICHVPKPGREPDVWWLGFDCAHAMDYAPKLQAQMRFVQEATGRQFMQVYGLDDVYRDVAYVTSEVEHLAMQLKEMVYEG